MNRSALQQEIAVQPGAPVSVSADFVRLHVLPSGRDDRVFLTSSSRSIHEHLRVVSTPEGTRITLGSAHGLPWPLRDMFSPMKGGELLLYVPQRVQLDITATAGRVRAQHLSGELSIHSDAGRIDVDSFHGHLRVAASAGRIEGTNISGRLDVSSNAGSVRLEVSGLDPGEHRVHTNLGSARVDLPRGLPVRIEAHTTMGGSRVTFPSHPQAAAVLRLWADLGSVRVRESSRVWGQPGPARSLNPPNFQAWSAPNDGRHESARSRPAVAERRGFSGEDAGRARPELGDREQALAFGVALEDWKRLERRVATGALSPEVARELARALRR